MKEAKDKAEELIEKFRDELNSFDEYDWILTNKAIQCALICVDRNIETLTNLVNDMDYFSNESRQVIWQLIENEQQVKQEILNRQ